MSRSDKALALALSLTHAETRLLALTGGQVDAVVDPLGRTYLLRPAQEHLLQRERRLQSVMESTADVIMVVDRGGVILSHNRAMHRVFGFEQEELVGRHLFDLIHEEDLPAVYAAFFNVIEEFQESATTRFRQRVPGGSFHTLEATVGRLRDVTSRSVVFSVRPMSSLRPDSPEKAGREVAYAHGSQAKDRFLAMLSHELRTPLTPALLGLAELQQDARFTEARPVLAMIRRNLELQSRLLEELTDFTGVGLHKVRLRSESIDAHEAIGFIVEMCRSEISASKTDILLNLQATETDVLADSVRLQQVMWNLLKNAIKFSTSGSRVSITTCNEPGGRLAIEFADHGIGIEPELLPLIFDCFRQSELPGQRVNEGLGLGLFIAKGLTEAQGGTLTAFSKGRGQGATFRLTLAKAPVRPVPAAVEVEFPFITLPANNSDAA